MPQKVSPPSIAPKATALTHVNTSQGSLYPVSAPDSLRRLPDNRVAIMSASGQILDWLEGASPEVTERFVSIYTDLILTRRLPGLIDWSFLGEKKD